MDTTNNTLRGDDQRIDLFQDHEITYWTYELHCTSEDLLKAVNRVGPSIKAIRAFLEKFTSAVPG